MTRYLILAQGGVDARWGAGGKPFLGAPKQLIMIDGETVLGRAVRLLRERGATDVIVTAPQDDRFKFPGARVITQDQSGWSWPGLNVIEGTVPLWSTTDRTTVLFGDVFYTDQAMDLITSCDEDDVWFYRRPTASKLTGHPWDEPFAFSFLPDHHQHLHDTAARLVAAHNGPKRLHLWKLFAALQGVDARDAKACRNLPRQTPIDDWTDDIDKPEQAVAWLGRYYERRIDATVVMPWRDTGCRARREAFNFAVNWWDRIGVEVVVASDDEAPHFNVAQARNRGAAATDSRVLVFCDSDTIVPSDQFWCAAYLAQESGQMVLPYTAHRRLDVGTTRRLLQGRHRRGGRLIYNHVSGVVTISREGFESTGFDERFVGWGAEDRAFYAACVTLLGEHDRLPGESIHLHHPRSPDRSDPDDDPRRAANLALGGRYKTAAGIFDRAGWLPQIGGGGRGPSDPGAMRALMSEPGGPLYAKDEAHAP